MINMIKNNKLKLKYQTTIQILNQITRELTIKYNNIVKFKIDENLPMNYAETNENKNKILVTIGIKGIKDQSYKAAKTTISEINFITCMINLFHENTHVKNILNHYQNCRETKQDDVEMTIAYLANHHNNQYNLNTHKRNPCEIDAEQNGILDTYDYLCITYPKQEKLWEKLIINYVNTKISNEHYFISKPNNEQFTSLNEINEAFNDAFKKSKINTTVHYVANNYTYQNDLIDQLWGYPKWKPIMTKLDDEKHGFEKNKMIASIVNYIHPEYKKQLPVLNNIDLTPETIFKQSFPPIPNELNPSTNQSRIKQAEKLTNNITYPDNNTTFSL